MGTEDDPRTTGLRVGEPSEGPSPTEESFLKSEFEERRYLSDLEDSLHRPIEEGAVNWGTINRKPEYSSDGLVTIHTCDFRADPEFQRTKALATSLTGFRYEVDWRLHTALWVAEQCSTLDGDFVECGVDIGFLSAAIVHHLDFGRLDKTFFLVDTFSGIPIDLVTEEERRINPHVNMPNHFSGTFERTSETFRESQNVKVIQGRVPETLEQLQLDRVAYVSLDMNNAYSEAKSAEYLWDRLVPGGMILLDDYCRNVTYVAQRKALDEFARARGVGVLAMATGQGLVVKR